MRVFRCFGRCLGSDGPRLAVEVDGQYFDLSAASADFANISSWLSLTDPVVALSSAFAGARAFPIVGELALLPPIDAQEVWACGVTYLRSKTARMAESDSAANFYDRVYEAERPEIFFKATPIRVAGPGDAIRIRQDSTWNVPEPELALVLSSSGSIVGYTIGNDVSSRSIEGENPLYLPQAKIYDGCCALGPAILIREDAAGPFIIQMTILRDGNALFS